MYDMYLYIHYTAVASANWTPRVRAIVVHLDRKRGHMTANLTAGSQPGCCCRQRGLREVVQENSSEQKL